MESVVKHTPNTYYLELRQDYITLCTSLTYRKDKSRSSHHCKALILSIMEKWTNEKVRKNKDQYIYMTYPQWIEEMYEMFARNVVIDSLEELIHDGFLQREAYKTARGGRDQYKYLLNYQHLNKQLSPTFTNQPCEEEQSGKINDQGLQINDATVKNQLRSSSPTLKSKPFIESDTQNHSIKSKRRSSSSKVMWYIRNNMKNCLKTLNDGTQDEVYLAKAQQMYTDSGIDDLLFLQQKIDQAIQNTQNYAWNRSPEEKMEYFFKHLEKSLSLQNERIAQ